MHSSSSSGVRWKYATPADKDTAGDLCTLEIQTTPGSTLRKLWPKGVRVRRAEARILSSRYPSARRSSAGDSSRSQQFSVEVRNRGRLAYRTRQVANGNVANCELCKNGDNSRFTRRHQDSQKSAWILRSPYSVRALKSNPWATVQAMSTRTKLSGVKPQQCTHEAGAKITGTGGKDETPVMGILRSEAGMAS